MTRYAYDGKTYDDLEDCIRDIVFMGDFWTEFYEWLDAKYTASDLFDRLYYIGYEEIYGPVHAEFAD
jgi:hypothetical protein